MIIWVCDCGCEVKENKPVQCPICKKKDSFTESECAPPSKEDLKYSKVYEESLKQLEIYEEGCPPKKMDPLGEDC